MQLNQHQMTLIGEVFHISSTFQMQLSEQVRIVVTYKDMTVKQVVEQKNLSLADENTISFTIEKPEKTLQSFVAHIEVYDQNCEHTVSTLILSETVQPTGFGCHPVFQWDDHQLVEGGKAYLMFGAFQLTLLVVKEDEALELDFLKPKQVIPMGTTVPRALTVDLSSVMFSLKQSAECPSFDLQLTIRGEAIFDSSTHG